MEPTTPASRDSWQTHRMPEQRQQLPYSRIFSADQFERIKQGFVPEEMEDKWFVYFEDGWLNLHRSWTGYCIFQLALEQARDGWAVTEVWINRDESQYRSTNIEEDIEHLENILRCCLKV